MSTIYQSTEDVKPYAEIESASSGGGENSMKIKAQKEKHIAQYIRRSEQYEEIRDYC
jgi:hypothetical protein